MWPGTTTSHLWHRWAASNSMAVSMTDLKHSPLGHSQTNAIRSLGGKWSRSKSSAQRRRLCACHALTFLRAGVYAGAEVMVDRRSVVGHAAQAGTRKCTLIAATFPSPPGHVAFHDAIPAARLALTPRKVRNQPGSPRGPGGHPPRRSRASPNTGRGAGGGVSRPTRVQRCTRPAPMLFPQSALH